MAEKFNKISEHDSVICSFSF